jgi:chromosome transmission fidelity protein 8
VESVVFLCLLHDYHTAKILEEFQWLKMSIALRTRSSWAGDSVVTATNPLPALLQTPSGLALLELQGTINLPGRDDEALPISTDGSRISIAEETPIGCILFPEYDKSDPGSTAWMKRVYLYVGKHQRLTGEVKKLPKAIAVIRKKAGGTIIQREQEEVDRGQIDELEIVEIVKYKILFSSRPEPVGSWGARE